MSIITDREIIELVNSKGMIAPFLDELRSVHHITGEKLISWGLSSCGYDPRLAEEFKIFKNNPVYSQKHILDPKKFDPEAYVTHNGSSVLIPPNGFILGRTVEEFNIPEDVFGICISKSTYARCGIICNVTPLEPGSKGHVTLEFSNTTSLPAKMYANEGACQFIFFKTDVMPLVNYAMRNGKYMNQTGVTDPKN